MSVGNAGSAKAAIMETMAITATASMSVKPASRVISQRAALLIMFKSSPFCGPEETFLFDLIRGVLAGQIVDVQDDARDR